MGTADENKRSRKTLFDEIGSLIDVPNRPDAVRKAKAFHVKYILARFGTIVVACLLLILCLFRLMSFWVFLPIFIIAAFSGPFLVVTLIRGSVKILNNHCDTLGALVFFLWLTKYFWRKDMNCAVCVFNIGISDIYAGRLEDAEKVRRVCEQKFPNATGTYVGASLGIEVAITRKDWDAFQRDYRLFSQASSNIPPKRAFRINQVLQYPQLVELYKQGKYEELYNGLVNYIVPHKLVSAETRRNYYLYKVALLLGNPGLAEQHANFVRTFGGCTCYRAEITGIPVEQLQPLENPPTL